MTEVLRDHTSASSSWLGPGHTSAGGGWCPSPSSSSSRSSGLWTASHLRSRIWSNLDLDKLHGQTQYKEEGHKLDHLIYASYFLFLSNLSLHNPCIPLVTRGSHLYDLNIDSLGPLELRRNGTQTERDLKSEVFNEWMFSFKCVCQGLLRSINN